ncbi:MAG: amidohydrolase family protein [Verrucomicrobia bacterium]|nr:amidohydrolase family protein [Verrucomicrobiota bacterium]
MRTLFALALSGGLAALALASDSIPGNAPAGPVLLRGGVIHPVSGPSVEGDLLFDQGKIVAIGPALTAPPKATVIELKGRSVHPGLIAANTQLGLTEHELVRATADSTEAGTFNPNARTQLSINPDSELIPVTRANGVLVALAVPGGGEASVAGMSSLLQLDGWTYEEMTLRPAVALHVLWPEMRLDRSRRPRPGEDPQKELDKKLRDLKDFFAAARAYQTAVAAGKRGAVDLRFEAMLPVLKGERPVFVHAQEWKQIESALAWSAEEKLAITLVGGQDAWRVAARLKERNIAVICSAPSDQPLRRGDDYDAAFALAGKLHAAGVRFCLARAGSSFEATNERNLPFEAAMAAAHGLPRAEALKAVTLYPAQLLGVADRLGSLEVGKDATLIVTKGDPLEIAHPVELAWIAGRPVDLSSKHTRLRDKYQRRLGQ